MIDILFVDDHKLPREYGCQSLPQEINTKVVRNYVDAILELEAERWDELWLDRDLQDPRGDGFAILTWLSEHIDKVPDKIHIISANFVLAKKMREMAATLVAMKKKNACRG